MAKVQRVKYFKISLEDKPGALLGIAHDLKAKNIGLAGIWAYATQPGSAEACFVAKNPDKLRNAWKSSGVTIAEGTALFLKGTDKTGALVKSLEVLAQAGISITAIDAIAVGGNFGSFLHVAPADVDKAAAALGAK